jgi:subtilisin family serine protease
VGDAPAHGRLQGFVELPGARRWASANDVLVPDDEDQPDVDSDGSLDRESGHGTFIAGIIRRLAPEAAIVPRGVLTSFGDGDDWSLANGIQALVDSTDRLDILNLSLSGYTEDDRPPLATRTVLEPLVKAGTVVVAAAGNDGSCRPAWPAALDEVIGVAALDCSGPASFTNHGPWVDACAPGVGIISTFLEFQGNEQPIPELDGFDPDTYAGYASWSGTSFSAPIVCAAIAREMTRCNVTAAQAADRLLRTHGLLRLPDLGVVVNLA